MNAIKPLHLCPHCKRTYQCPFACNSTTWGCPACIPENWKSNDPKDRKVRYLSAEEVEKAIAEAAVPVPDSRRDGAEQFILPSDIVTKAYEATRAGIRIRMTPDDLIRQMRHADDALNGDSNDTEHDALCVIREWLSDVFEDPERRTHGRR